MSHNTAQTLVWPPCFVVAVKIGILHACYIYMLQSVNIKPLQHKYLKELYKMSMTFNVKGDSTVNDHVSKLYFYFIYEYTTDLMIIILNNYHKSFTFIFESV